ncbi:MAG: hypothetical protein AAF802_00615 [Planctomycetota bacterium]
MNINARRNDWTHTMRLSFPVTFAAYQLLILTCCLSTVRSGEPSWPQPRMNVPDKLVYSSDFSESGKIDTTKWQARQGTRWEIIDGVLRGKQSSPEFQAKKDHHKGLEPRIKSLITPRDFIAKFSFRFIDGEETSLLPLVEFGHHNVRLKFSTTGVRLLADSESVLLAETKAIKRESGVWYHVVAERKGDEFLIQFLDGPTLYAKHASLAIPLANASDGLGIAGTRFGVLEIDNVELWSITSTQLKSWESTRDQILTANPVRLK